MARARHNEGCGANREPVPPFWLPTSEEGAQLIERCIYDVAEGNWSWAFHLVRRELNDGTRANEIVQEVAVEVTDRLREDAEVGRNLSGYFRTAMIRHVRSVAVRESRITYEGSAQDLEANHNPSAPDWAKSFEDRIILQSIACYMSHPVRHILNYRLLDYEWSHIARRVGLTEKQTKSRFYYGARQAYEEMLAIQAMRARKRESEEWK